MYTVNEIQNKIFEGDSLTKLKELESDSVNCIVTSPPYWALRDYKTEDLIWDSVNNKEDCEHEFQTIETKRSNSQGGKSPKLEIKNTDNFQAYTDYNNRVSYSNQCSKCNAWKGQLGQEPTIELYINHLVSIFNEAKRVLKKEGTCFIVISDTYASGGGLANEQSFRRKAGINTESNPDYPSKAKLRSKLGKSLLMVPERFAIRMIEKGWILRNKIIWHKRNCMPSSVKDRFTIDYEYIYFFTKNQKYYFKTQYESMSQAGIERYKYSFGGNQKNVAVSENGKSINNSASRIYFPEKRMLEPNGKGRIKRCIWTINTKPFSEAHFAVFPEELVKQCIDAGCPEDGICFDPFMGSGTTALVALKHNRKFLGIELNPDYIKIAAKRLEPYLKQTKISNYELVH